MSSDRDSVKVALRIRPLVEYEKNRGNRDITKVFEKERQVHISDKSFTFNYVFGPDTTQEYFYDTCVKPMLINLYDGYNTTILAYGQTGSGKTYSMGTSCSTDNQMGVIPRVIKDIFNHAQDTFTQECKVAVSFIELYNEAVYDLLSGKPKDQSQLDIREDICRSTFIPGLNEVEVSSPQAALENLQKASYGRATAATNMNEQSSRSHAIFTISLNMQQKGSSISKTAKFHLVDLAGSERSKKTGATGQTFKEGVNINKGLLALGNVISALGADEGAQSFICYRDSNLTRLLKDSLGGNSITLMVACVSPADYNSEETLSTLRYANRARNIKNKPIVNEDPKAAEINKLNKIIQELRLQVEISGCPEDIEFLRKERDDLKARCSNLSHKLTSTLNEKTILMERFLLLQNNKEEFTSKLNELKDNYNTTVTDLHKSLGDGDIAAVKDYTQKLASIQEDLAMINKMNQANDNEIKRLEVIDIRSRSHDSPTASSETEIIERNETMAVHQYNLHSDLREVSKDIAIKEDLLKKLSENTFYMVDVTQMEDMETKITSLEKEKAELMVQLKNVSSNKAIPNNKLSEERRKRVKELENELQSLKRKLNDQTRLIKLKEKEEVKIKQLGAEIQTLKSTKVMLLKNMRLESDRFSKWKVQRERELSALKNKDRKMQTQMKQMETHYNLQQNVWRRKVMEANAAAKRLKDNLALRKQVQDSKLSGKIERFEPMLQHEFAMKASIIAAKVSLDRLIEDRAILQEQVDRLKKNDEESDFTMKSEEVQDLEEALSVRSNQIQDLQQKLLDSKDDKSKSIVHNIQTMAEAKYVINAMFELVENRERDVALQIHKLSDTKQLQEEQEEHVKRLEEKLKAQEKEYKNRLDVMASGYADKESVFLSQIRDVVVKDRDAETNKLFSIMQEKIDNLEMEKAELKSCNAELRQLQDKEQATLERPSKRTKLRKSKEDTKENEKAATPARFTLDDFIIDDTPMREMNVSVDDRSNDPDWVKTPTYRNLRRIREKAGNGKNDGCCFCKNICRARCSCIKFERVCGEHCRCSVECENRNIDRNNSSDTGANEETDRYNTFLKRPKYNI